MRQGRVDDGPVGFAHEAFFYADIDGFLAGLVPFVADGIEADEPVLVALPAGRVEAMRADLGRDAKRVQFLEMERVGRNPACIIPAWHRFVANRPADGRPIRGIGEPIWSGRSDHELSECQLHESLLNDAFASAPAFTLVCPYDVASLPASTVDEAQRSHPVLLERGVRRSSTSYDADRGRREQFRRPLPPPPVSIRQARVRGPELVHDLRLLRRLVADHAADCGLEFAKQRDLVLATDEIVVNAVRHGGGDAVLKLWRDGDRAVAEVSDQGLLDDAMAGRREPDHLREGGRGLWIVNQLCDLVQIRSTPEGTVVRLFVGP